MLALATLLLSAADFAPLQDALPKPPAATRVSRA